MLRYGFTVNKFKSDGLPRSSNKTKTVRSPSDRGFEQKTFNFTLRDNFTHIFYAHLETYQIFCENA